MYFFDRFKFLCSQRNVSMSKVLTELGLSRSNITYWQSTPDAIPKKDALKKLSDYFNVSYDYLLGNDNFSHPKFTEDVVTLPVIGEIAAGFDNLAIESWTGETVEIPTSYVRGYTENDFIVLTVKGDSMYPDYREGDKVVIKKQPYPDYSGQIGAVIYEDELSTLKKIEFPMDKSWLKLVPLNLVAHSPQKYEGEALDHIHYLGVPKWVIREVKE